jgi:hypothetical protein
MNSGQITGRRRTVPPNALACTPHNVRLILFGVSSNAQAMISAIGNPITAMSTTSCTAQLGISKNEKTLRANLDHEPADNRIGNRDFVNVPSP